VVVLVMMVLVSLPTTTTITISHFLRINAIRATDALRLQHATDIDDICRCQWRVVVSLHPSLCNADAQEHRWATLTLTRGSSSGHNGGSSASHEPVMSSSVDGSSGDGGGGVMVVTIMVAAV